MASMLIAGVVRADLRAFGSLDNRPSLSHNLSRGARSTHSQPSLPADSGYVFVNGSGLDAAMGDLGLIRDMPVVAPVVYPDALPRSSSGRPVQELPPSPGSAALFLSAALSMGGWHVVRSARHIDLGAIPDWYHTGGPDRIGHAVPIDPNFTTLQPCELDVPVGLVAGMPIQPVIWRDRRVPFEPQRFLSVAAPRGPPARLS